MFVTEKDWQKVVPLKNLKINEPLFAHTTFKIGGIADWFVTPSNFSELKRVVSFCNQHHVKYFILGAGSNTLFSDSGFAGAIISLEKMQSLIFDGECVIARAGVKLAKVISECVLNRLTGFEFTVGIPASIGGAVCMNAGAFGSEIADFIQCVWVLKDGKIKKLTAQQCEFGYRSSRFKTSGEIILKVAFKLQRGLLPDILNRLSDYLLRRKKTQPFQASAGSVFKRTTNFPAGFLIEQAGLKGMRIGGAKVSEKHANFIVNMGNASAKDVCTLIKIVQNEVEVQFGIKLEKEIVFIGEKDE